MANKTLFKSIVGKLIPKTDALNEELAPAYALPPKHMLAQYAATGCMNHTFYASAEQQLQVVLDLCGKIEPEFIARTALYTRRRGFMKDLPALLCAILSVKGPGLLAEVFDRVIDDGRMLRNFVQIMRSGTIGRKSLGTLPKRLVLQWLERRTDEQLFIASVGNDPSLADIVKMVHPKPKTKSREALFGYLIGREYEAANLPPIVKQYEAFKKVETSQPPDVPFQMLTSLPMSQRQWVDIARRAPWQMTRMNLNTFARHGVFDEPGMAEQIANRLRNAELIGRAKVFPYQLLCAYCQIGEQVPAKVREALQDAMEIALANVPRIDGKVYVFPDVSGSMQSPVTGYRRGATTAVRCVDVAALVAAAVLRKNPEAEVIPFEHDVVSLRLNPRDSVLTNAAKLAGVGGGGTSCSAPLRLLNKRQARGDLIIYVSDNESWVDAPRMWGGDGGTATMRQWQQFRGRNASARMVCIDIQPYGTVQAKEREDILNIGGFSDQVFGVIQLFADGQLEAGHWVGEIEKEVI
jgi:60 kDa SS-A/Ro ribonucleoprotein